MKKDIFKHYDILGIERKAKLDEVVLKKAFKSLVREWHPDLNQHRIEEATEKFKEINNSYQELLFVLASNNGELPPGILNAKDFLSHIGFDRLAELTQDTLVEIDIEMAARGLGHSGAGQASTAIDAAIMKKLRIWARGPAFENNSQILDQDGHFTNRSIVNILNYMDTIEFAPVKKRKGQFLGMEFETVESDEKEVKISEIVRDWINGSYIRTHKNGWMHKSKFAYWRNKVVHDLIEGLKDTNINREVLSKIVVMIADNKISDAKALLKTLLPTMADGGVKSRKELKNEKVALKRQKQELLEDINSIARKVKVEPQVLLNASNIDELQINLPIMALFSERISIVKKQLSEVENSLMRFTGNEAETTEAIHSFLLDLEDLELIVS